MLKLARNALVDMKEFIDGDGKVINGEHIKALHNTRKRRVKICK